MLNLDNVSNNQIDNEQFCKDILLELIDDYIKDDFKLKGAQYIIDILHGDIPKTLFISSWDTGVRKINVDELSDKLDCYVLEIDRKDLSVLNRFAHVKFNGISKSIGKGLWTINVARSGVIVGIKINDYTDDILTIYLQVE